VGEKRKMATKLTLGFGLAITLVAGIYFLWLNLIGIPAHTSCEFKWFPFTLPRFVCTEHDEIPVGSIGGNIIILAFLVVGNMLTLSYVINRFRYHWINKKLSWSIIISLIIFIGMIIGFLIVYLFAAFQDPLVMIN
jgi:hypothetical protein